MEHLIYWIISKLQKNRLPSKPAAIHEPNTEWAVSFVSFGKPQTRILTGESEQLVKERFLQNRPHSKIETIVCLG